jgi:hypothetical protein
MHPERTSWRVLMGVPGTNMVLACGEKMGFIEETSQASSVHHDMRSPCGEKMGFIEETSQASSVNHDMRSLCGEKMGFMERKQPEMQ